MLVVLTHLRMVAFALSPDVEFVFYRTKDAAQQQVPTLTWIGGGYLDLEPDPCHREADGKVTDLDPWRSLP